MPVTINGSGQLAVQIVSATKTDTSTLNTGSWADVPGMSVNITPRNASNRVLILTSVCTGSNDAAQFYRIVRDSTVICVGTSVSSREPVSMSNQGMQANGNAVVTLHQNFLDSPATTSSVTYKLQYRNQGGTIYVNRSFGDTDNNNFARGASTITVMELAYA
jgi:hypothetical protein